MDRNGVFLYTGEGQVGPMEFTPGNRAIRDHGTDGKDLHLFRSLGKGKGYRYLGVFACSSWEFRQGIDRKGDERRVIVFHLVQLSEVEQGAPSPPPPGVPLDQLRQLALQAASGAEQSKPQEAKGLYYKRSAAVREYVLARAGGVCESCGKPTRRISDGGPDHPRWVAAICPNCHREVHYGKDGKDKNQQLQQYLALLNE